MNNIRQVNSHTYITGNKDDYSENPKNNDKLYLIQQFYISSNENRQKENKYCLKKNTELGLFDDIFLLNERIYTEEELGVREKEVKQINIGKRLTYDFVFDFVKKNNIEGYIFLSNSDIFFDKTVLNARKSSLTDFKSVKCQLRIEFDPEKKIENLKPTHHYTMQDTWIYHSKYNPNFSANFSLGSTGCDNHISFVFHENDYKVYNEPRKIRTYHYHTSNFRTHRNHVKGPYLMINPI